MQILVLCISLLLVYQIHNSSSSELDEGEAGAFMFLSTNDEELEEGCHPNPKDPKDSKHPCEEGKLISFLSCLQVMNPLSIITLATKNKLDKTCQNVSKTIEKTQTYLKSCSLQTSQDGFLRLLKGVTTLHKKLCTKDAYHKSFSGQKQCFAKLQGEFDSCNGPADWTESADPRKVCKAYQDVVDCYYIKTSVLCGAKAAGVIKELVLAVVDSIITVDCSSKVRFGNLTDTSSVKKLQDSKMKSSTSSNKPTASFFKFLFIFCILSIINILNFPLCF